MIINQKSRNKKLKNNILSLAQEAKKAKLNNPNTINSTAGMLFDDNGKIYTFDAVKNAMNDLSNEKMFTYSDTGGSVNFRKAILEWVFGSKINEFKDYHLKAVATPGGSGAISLTFSTYLNRGDKVLLPKVMWETYITYAEERECSYLTYDLYDENGFFNIESIKYCIEQIGEQENIVLVVNDPCQNPTGFCLKDRDYDLLIELLNSYSRNIVLLIDMAYFDYYSSNGNLIRSRYTKLTRLNDNILTIFAFSGSKTFGLYGLRVGAAIVMSKDEEEVIHFKNCFEYIARANWSSVTTLGESIIEELVLNDEYKESFKDELCKVSGILVERAKIFIEESEKCGLVTLPFECGFFVCVPTSNPQKLMDALKKDDVYVITTKTCIRVAICAINKDECARLPQIIKNRMEMDGLN